MKLKKFDSLRRNFAGAGSSTFAGDCHSTGHGSPETYRLHFNNRALTPENRELESQDLTLTWRVHDREATINGYPELGIWVPVRGDHKLGPK